MIFKVVTRRIYSVMVVDAANIQRRLTQVIGMYRVKRQIMKI